MNWPNFIKTRISYAVAVLICLLCAPYASASDSDDTLDAILAQPENEEFVSVKMHQIDLVLRDILPNRFAHTPSAETQITDLFRFGPQTHQLIDPEYERQLEANLAWLNKLSVSEMLETAQTGPVFDIPMRSHPLVDRYINYFTGRGRKFFGRWLARADRYKPIMQPILREMGLPEDTIYLAMIESGFSAKAFSSAAASGFWQFIPSTGRRYKLRQDFWVDERRDFIFATRSAGKFLTTLYKRFGNWHLAWAGYNAGGGRISRALKKYNTNDFWTLIEHKKSLAKETQHYVPKLLAAAWVSKNRKLYGFENIKPLSPLSWDEVKVSEPTDLKIMAQVLGTSLDTLTTLNPSWKQAISPPGRTSLMRVPQGMGEQTQEWLSAQPATEKLDYVVHKVRSGDTLSEIARAYGSSAHAIKGVNKIRNARALRLGQKLMIPKTGIQTPRKKSVAKAQKVISRLKKQRARKPTPTKIASSVPRKTEAYSRTYQVRSGDTLWSIARRHQISVTKLKKLNQRRTNRIQIGEVLHVF
jgi:membrane-bound lytic murein transglycosylase D